ncbi:Acg family FMN-binding oxidoreductase [Kribbella sp. NBC_00889]|uniref:Acg family FMN-binding oxidoreductase n=1 Tax=Kribbella sp. NBC_00889 TaxID=2975974 RepID=UPI00386E8430|nr:nitroreductase family protein [Kribbella sp. NBC_00889]
MTATPAEDVRDQLLRAAVAAPSVHNTQPWRFRFRGWVVEVHRDRDRELPAEDRDRRMLYLSLGAAVFNLRVAAALCGYGTDTRSVLDRAHPDLVAEVELVIPGPDIQSLSALAPYVPLRRTNRQPYSDRRVTPEVQKLLELSARLEGALLDWAEAPARRRWLQLASSDAGALDDQDAARSAERRRWVGGARARDGVPSNALGPRSEGEISPVRDLAATPADESRTVIAFEAEPQLAVLSTRHDGRPEWLRAGQAMERVLLEATALGLSTSLLNQALEHDELRWLINDPLGPSYRPQVIIRVGYGPPVPATPRRPISDVLLD